MPISQILWSSDGRISRRNYWLWKLVISSPGLVVAGFLFVFPHAIKQIVHRPGSDQPLSALDATVLLILIVAGIVACALFIWISTALDLKRWHDLEKSGSPLCSAFPTGGIIMSTFECFRRPAPMVRIATDPIQAEKIGTNSPVNVVTRQPPLSAASDLPRLVRQD